VVLCKNRIREKTGKDGKNKEYQGDKVGFSALLAQKEN
jgi:hypothetical protein